MALDVLVVDDEADIRELVAGVLEDEGYSVRTAADSSGALDAIEDRRPSLVLLDIAMPGLDGIEVARALSRGGDSPAVVFVTAFDQFAVAAFDVAAIDYLMKPVDADRLARSIDRARAYLKARAERAPDEAPAAPTSPWSSRSDSSNPCSSAAASRELWISCVSS